MSKLLIPAMLIPAALFAQPAVQFSRLPSVTVQSAVDRLDTDSRGRIYALQGQNVVRLSSLGAAPEVIPTGFTGITPIPINMLVLDDGLVYLTGASFSVGQDLCGGLPGTVSFLGTPIPGEVTTVFLTRLDLRPSPSLPTASVCAHALTNIGSAVVTPGPNGTVFLASAGQPSFPLTQTFGPVAPGSGTGWIVKLDANLSRLASVGLSPLTAVLSVTAGKGKVAIGGTTASSLFPQLGSLPAPPAGPGPLDGFVAVFSDDLATLHLSSRLGGGGRDIVTSVQCDETGSIYFGGTTESTNLNVVNGHQMALGGGRDLMYGRITATLRQFQYFSYLGGADEEILPRFALVPNDGGMRVVFQAGQTPDTLLTVNPLAGSPRRDAVVAHLGSLGRPSYLTRLRQTDPLRVPLDIVPFGPAGALVTGFADIGTADNRDLLMRIDDPAVDVRLRLAGVSAVPGVFTTEVHAENLSVSHAFRATVTGKLPLSGPIYLGVSVSNGICTRTAKDFSCDVGILSPLPSSVRITIKTNGNSIGLVKVTSDTPDPNPANNFLN